MADSITPQHLQTHARTRSATRSTTKWRPYRQTSKCDFGQVRECPILGSPGRELFHWYSHRSHQCCQILELGGGTCELSWLVPWRPKRLHIQSL
eukprot:467879-Amphidinium_carterae.1